jgi:hypothetical protein
VDRKYGEICGSLIVLICITSGKFTDKEEEPLLIWTVD